MTLSVLTDDDKCNSKASDGEGELLGVYVLYELPLLLYLITCYLLLIFNVAV